LVGGTVATQFGVAAPFWLGALAGVVVLIGASSTFSNEVVDPARSAGSPSADRGIIFAFIGAHIDCDVEFVKTQWANDGSLRPGISA
jgi:hypothetical protein